ncbi:MAG TPA: alpha/beta fold hydrolase, partial [Verrucomicrobiae bacterium]|nr:alpha/beta fold hydrolase [Verrucomicrobiae bacterium]
MKKSFILIAAALAFTCCAFAQNWNTNGALPTPLSPIVRTPDQSNIVFSQTATAVTNNVFSTTWPSDTNGWKLQGAFSTNSGEIFPTNYGVMSAHYPINMPWGANAHFLVSFKFPTAGTVATGDFFDVGFSTNIFSPDDQSAFWGAGMTGGMAVAPFRLGFSASEWPAWGTNKVNTNTTINVCVNSDPKRISYAFVWPNHSNEMRAMFAWTNVPNGTISNFTLIAWNTGSNGIFGAAGGRTAPQTISPRSTIEGRTDFVIWTVDDHNDYIRVVIPAQYDSGTNIGNLMVFVHGNTGDYKGDYETVVGDESTTGDSCMGYFNALTTNNFILVSYLDPNSSGGRSDSWGTTNSYACIDAAIKWVRQRYAFSNIFLWGESAGGATALGYSAQHREKIAGILMNHAVYSIANRYLGQKSDIDAAYGGSTAAEFTATDPATFPATAWAGIPIRITASSGDNVVTKTNQTDLLVRAMGGIVAGNFTNTPVTPEIDDFQVDGPANTHGGACYTPAVAAGDISFLKRCLGYAAQKFTAPTGWTPVIGW